MANFPCTGRDDRNTLRQEGVLASGSPLQKTLTADLSEILPVSHLETYRIYYINHPVIKYCNGQSPVCG